MDVSRPIGVRVLEGAGLFIGVILAAGQTLALMDYALVTSCGPQEAADEVTAMGVAHNEGFGLGDKVIYLPLLSAGLVGLWRGRPWGV